MTPKQLKASILQLAISGKLVPQDPNDEPASELLKKIAAAKNEKSVKKLKPLPPITYAEKPFPIPDSWQWVRLGDLTDGDRFITYGIVKLGKEDTDGVKVLRCSDVKPGALDLSNVRTVTTSLSNEYRRTVLSGGEVLINVRGTLGGCAVASEAVTGFNIAREVAMIPLCRMLEPKYIMFLLLSNYFVGFTHDNLHGIAYKGLNIEILTSFPVPLPSISEQKRIVTKIEALLKYVDACEDSRKNLAEKMSATLKRSVLQEAIQGRLVPQDPNDEPASKLLKKIDVAIDTKATKRSKPLPPITDDEKPFPIPDSWRWARIGAVCDVFNGNSINEQIKRTKYSKKCDGYSFIATPDVGFDSKINYESGVYIPKGEPKFRIAPKGTVLMCIEGGSAARKFGFLDRDVMFGNKLCCFHATGINTRYIYWYLQSMTFYAAFQEKMTGIIGGVGPETLRSFLIPLPPLAEQERIVAKVDSLLAGVGTLRNLDEVDAWILNRRIEKHKEALCKRYRCEDIRFEAHAEYTSTRHPVPCAYLEVTYSGGLPVAVDAFRKEAERLIGFHLDCTSAPEVFPDGAGRFRSIFQIGMPLETEDAAK